MTIGAVSLLCGLAAFALSYGHSEARRSSATLNAPSLPDSSRLRHVRTMGMKMNEWVVQKDQLAREQEDLKELAKLKVGVHWMLNTLHNRMKQPGDPDFMDDLIPMTSKSLRHLLDMARHPHTKATDAQEELQHIRRNCDRLLNREAPRTNHDINSSLNIDSECLAIKQINQTFQSLAD